jgi:hypothetical protein
MFRDKKKSHCLLFELDSAPRVAAEMHASKIIFFIEKYGIANWSGYTFMKFEITSIDPRKIWQ